jgi:HD-like signal output (HDOD) protein
MIDWAEIRSAALGESVEQAAAFPPPSLNLPALPHAVTRFVEKSGQPDVQVKDLAAIVETESGLTVELLRHVNSTFVGLRSKAGSAAQAINLMGIRPSRNLLITVGMRAAVQSKQSKLINQACFWNATLQKALFAREVALLLRTDADLAFAGAMLQDYLLPVLTNDLFDKYAEFVRHRDRQPLQMCEFENDAFGWDHAFAAACLAHRWKLPDELVCCILFHHAGLEILAHPELGRTPVAAVAVSALLPDQMRQCYQGLEQLQVLESKWPAFNLQDLARTVDQKHEEIGLGLRNDYPLARRCRGAVTVNPYADGSIKTTALA